MILMMILMKPSDYLTAVSSNASSGPPRHQQHRSGASLSLAVIALRLVKTFTVDVWFGEDATGKKCVLKVSIPCDAQYCGLDGRWRSGGKRDHPHHCGRSCSTRPLSSIVAQCHGSEYVPSGHGDWLFTIHVGYYY